MNKKLRSLLGVSVIALLTVMLAACGSSDESANGEGEVNIQYWHMQVEEDRVAVIDDLISDFEKENPGITVDQVAIQEDDFSTKISASLGAQQMPALLEVVVDQSLFLGKEGVLATELHKEIISNIGEDQYFDGPLNITKSPNDDGYYGVPVSGWVQGIWYRKDLFEEKGLEAPTTWENILAAAKAFHDPDNKQYGMVIGTSEDEFAEQTFSQFALSNNSNVFDPNGDVTFNTDGMIEALDYYKNLAQYTPPGAESWREARDLYISENTPMVMYSSYLMSDLVAEGLADKTGFTLPEKKQPASFGEVTSLAISNTVSEEKQKAAKKFIEFVMKKENYINYLHMSPGGSNPTIASIAEDPKYLENEVLKAYGDEATKIASGLNNLQRFGFTEGVLYPEMGDISAKVIIGKGIFDMTVEDKTPKEVAEQAQTSMEDTVK